MTASDLLAKIRRALRKPPRYVLGRVAQELRAQLERYLAPLRAARTNSVDLAHRAGHADIASWWTALAARAFVSETYLNREALDRLCPGDAAQLLSDGERAIAREVDLLGSGSVELGTPIDWHRDYKTGHRWPPAYCRDIEYSNLDRPSDVKFPWEVSRMQWLIPACQAYVISGDERYADGVRDIIDEWIAANPYAMSVNWACTMDVAIRAMTWTWLFHGLHASVAWSDSAFQARFLRALWLHGDFITRHLEKSDINGNHYTADAAGLVFVGLFFGGSVEAKRWQELGWDILCDELPKQVFADGVDFEASVPYHRLVQELFLLPALYRIKQGLDVPPPYRERLLAMAWFTQAYSRPDGSVPLWGDADDARALPFRQKPINDHRYLLALAGVGLSEPSLVESFSGPRTEAIWMFGAEVAARLPDRDTTSDNLRSVAFEDGGFYVLRTERDHVFIDCGPLGLAGRGGHGHNDLLSFEAVLDGVHLVSDCGAHLYTASIMERNLFRSTAYHNTPKVDGEEINRFVRPHYLWALHDDARHIVDRIVLGSGTERLQVRHTGYERLASPVTIWRTFELEHNLHRLTVSDEFTGAGPHAVEVPLHLAIGVDVILERDAAYLYADGHCFAVTWAPRQDWVVSLEDARVSQTYGIAIPTRRLIWRRNGPLANLRVHVQPHACIR